MINNLTHLSKIFRKDYLLIAVVGLVILIPKFDFIDVPGTTTSIRVEDFLIAGLYLWWIVWLIKKRQPPKLTKIHLLMLLFIAVSMLSTSWGFHIGSIDSPALALLNILRRVEYFMIFWVAYSWLNIQYLKKYLWILAAILATVVVIGALQYFAILPMISTWQGYGGQLLYFNKNYLFLIATFAGHYELGGYLLIMVPIVLALFMSSTKWPRFGLALLLLGSYLLLYYSYSRAAYVAIIWQMFVILILYKKYFLAILPIVEIARVVYLYVTGQYSRYDYKIGLVSNPSPGPSSLNPQSTTSAVLTPTPTPTPTPTQTGGVDTTVQLSADTSVTLDPGGAVRVDIWKNATEHFKQSPILGTGYSSIGTGADNQYLRTLAETGLVGLGVFMSMLGYCIWYFYTAAEHWLISLNKYFLLACIAIILGLLAQAVLIDIFDSSKVAMLFWFVMALGFKVAQAQPDNMESQA